MKKMKKLEEWGTGLWVFSHSFNAVSLSLTMMGLK